MIGDDVVHFKTVSADDRLLMCQCLRSSSQQSSLTPTRRLYSIRQRHILPFYLLRADWLLRTSRHACNFRLPFSRNSTSVSFLLLCAHYAVCRCFKIARHTFSLLRALFHRTSCHAIALFQKFDICYYAFFCYVRALIYYRPRLLTVGGYFFIRGITLPIYRGLSLVVSVVCPSSLLACCASHTADFTARCTAKRGLRRHMWYSPSRSFFATNFLLSYAISQETPWGLQGRSG